MNKLPLAKYEGGIDRAMATAVYDSVIVVECPFCGSPREIEPDAHGDVECESCGKHYQIKGVC